MTTQDLRLTYKNETGDCHNGKASVNTSYSDPDEKTFTPEYVWWLEERLIQEHQALFKASCLLSRIL